MPIHVYVAVLGSAHMASEEVLLPEGLTAKTAACSLRRLGLGVQLVCQAFSVRDWSMH